MQRATRLLLRKANLPTGDIATSGCIKRTILLSAMSNAQAQKLVTQKSVEEINAMKDTTSFKISKKIFNLFFDLNKERRAILSELLYERTVDCLDYQAFFKDFQMADTFFSWYLVTELHVWMLSTRLMAEPAPLNVTMRDLFIKTMWTDVEKRIKLLGPVNRKVKVENLILLGEQFHPSMFGYDEGLYDDKILAGAIWQRFFNSECKDPLKIERLVLYVRKQIVMLDNLPSTWCDSIHTKVPWIPLKDITLPDNY